MNIGERIKNRRLELGLSVDEVAEKIGKNRATVYRYESREIENLPTSVLEPLAKALQTTPAFLIGWDREPDEIDKKVLELYPDFVPGKVFISDIVDARQKEEQLKNYLSSIYSDKEMIEDAYEINMNMQLYNKDGLKKLRERAEEISELSKYTDKDDETPPT